MPAKRVVRPARSAATRRVRVEFFPAGAKTRAIAERVSRDLRDRSLGATSVAFVVRGTLSEGALVRVPVTAADLAGIEPASARVFRVREDSFEPIWHSGVHLELGYAWARLDEPGTFVLIGLPADVLLSEAVREAALNRRLAPPGALKGGTRRRRADADEVLKLAMRPLLENDARLLHGLRRQLAAAKSTTGVQIEHRKARVEGGRVQPTGVLTAEALATRLAQIELGAGGLPEEQLFFDPAQVRPPLDWRPPWWIMPEPWLWEPRLFQPFWPYWFCWGYPWWWRCFRLCFFFSRDWWMYHHDEAHTGAASGCSGISSTTVGGLVQRFAIPLAGTVISIPCVVAGKVYVGVGNSSAATGGSGGTLYKIDLATGAIEHTFTFDTPPMGGSEQGFAGIGSSVAVSGGRVYVSGLNGTLYCLDTSLALQWSTDLRNRDLPRRQPIQSVGGTEGWSSPLVANGRVYVGFGVGEGSAGTAYGFVYCLDAASGNVDWVFCTNQFVAGVDNNPNDIPASVAGGLPAGWAAANGFVVRADPPQSGASPWSSAAYDAGLNRIYIGTGNSTPDSPLPNPRYGSGLLSLDATTGTFRQFFQAPPSSSYRVDDADIDVPGPPTLFTRAGTRYVTVGGKSGALFVLDANTLAQVAWRQLLPYDSGGNPFPAIDPHIGYPENYFGIFGSAAVHTSSGRLFVGIGGYSGAIDNVTTPFIRALDWATLADAWPVAGNNPPRYSMATPPVYSTPNEAGLGSPGVVNDVVFMGTSKAALYALSVADGHCLWPSGPIGGVGDYVLGPAIYGNSVVAGAGSRLYIWSL